MWDKVMLERKTLRKEVYEMQIFTVEIGEKTVSVFASTLDLLTFLYLHGEEFELRDGGKNLYREIAGGNVAETLNSFLFGRAKIREWSTGTDMYTSDEKEHGKDVLQIADGRPAKSWIATMEDGTKQTVVAPFMPLAVNEAQSEYIIENGKYQPVKAISQF